MARAIWKGIVSFGLVNIPVQLFSATRSEGLQFHMLSEDGSCRLRRKLYCPETDEDYDFKDTARGVEIAPEQYVLVQKEELDALAPDGGKRIEIEDFVNLEQIDPIYFHRTYYLAPAENAEKSYVLLATAMKETQQVAISRFVMRNHEYLGALRVMEDGKTLALETMHYHEEIRDRKELSIPEADTTKKELQLAKQLIESLSTEFRPEKYENRYKERLEELVSKKAKGKKVSVSKQSYEGAATVVDLMDVLKRSVEQTKTKPARSAKPAKSKRTAAKGQKKPKKSAKKAVKRGDKEAA